MCVCKGKGGGDGGAAGIGGSGTGSALVEDEGDHASESSGEEGGVAVGIGGYTPTRICLYWHESYYWQESSNERFWCMQCKGKCKDGRKIDIDHCNDNNDRQLFQVLPDMSYCLTQMHHPRSH